MSGYLQRLLDSALPASEPPTLAPVVKSTSPVFEQNQLFGLPGFQAGETDAGIIPPGPDDPGPQDPGAPAPLPTPPPLEMRQHASRPAPPPPWSDVGRSIPAGPLALRPAAADPFPPPPQGPFDSALELAWPDPGTVEPAPRLEPTPRTESARPADLAVRPGPQEVVFAPVAIEVAASETMPPVAAEAAAGPETEHGLAAPQIVTREAPHPAGGEAPRALEPAELTPATSPPASVLEPRARPDFRDVEPEADQPEPAFPQAPRITIGRVTVELVPDPAPVARPAVPSRTAAAASMIGPLGNRRTRRRLFVLSRL